MRHEFHKCERSCRVGYNYMLRARNAHMAMSARSRRRRRRRLRKSWVAACTRERCARVDGMRNPPARPRRAPCNAVEVHRAHNTHNTHTHRTRTKPNGKRSPNLGVRVRLKCIFYTSIHARAYNVCVCVCCIIEKLFSSKHSHVHTAAWRAEEIRRFRA